MTLETTHDYLDLMLTLKVSRPDPTDRPEFAKFGCVWCGRLIVKSDYDPDSLPVAWCFCDVCKAEIEEAESG